MRPLLLARDQRVFKIVMEHDSDIIKYYIASFFDFRDGLIVMHILGE